MQTLAISRKFPTANSRTTATRLARGKGVCVWIRATGGITIMYSENGRIRQETRRNTRLVWTP